MNKINEQKKLTKKLTKKITKKVLQYLKKAFNFFTKI